MALESLIVKQKICITLDVNSGSNIVPIFSYVPYSKNGYTFLDEYLEIKDLKAIGWIDSLDPIPFPVFELEDTESKQLLTAINLEWKSPRIELQVMCQINNLVWQKLQSFSLLNPDPYPYREYSLGSHTLGNNAMIGLKVADVGFGLLSNQDKVTIFADLVRYITLDQPPIIINVVSAAPTTPNPTPDPTPDPTSEEEEMPLKIISADYTLSNRDRIFAKNDIEGVGNFNLILPPNPVEGFEVEIISSNNYQGYKQVFILAGTAFFFGNQHSSNEIYLDNSRRGGKILFTQAEGWIAFPGSNPNFAISSSNN